MLSKLINNGYSTEDVIDLCELFLTQVTKFESEYKAHTHCQLIKELHKLKGGASILHLNLSVELLKGAEYSLQQELNKSSSLQLLEKLLKEVKADVNTLITKASKTT